LQEEDDFGNFFCVKFLKWESKENFHLDIRQDLPLETKCEIDVRQSMILPEKLRRMFLMWSNKSYFFTLKQLKIWYYLLNKENWPILIEIKDKINVKTYTGKYIKEKIENWMQYKNEGQTDLENFEEIEYMIKEERRTVFEAARETYNIYFSRTKQAVDEYIEKLDKTGFMYDEKEIEKAQTLIDNFIKEY